MRTRSRRREDSGATAVLVAILAVALFSMAALAVDLGNAWARKRAVQKQVDVSALSAGYLLPETSLNKLTIADRVAGFLNENSTSGQATVTAAQLVDGITGNGEVTFQDAGGHACVEGCIRMTVLAPAARVQFGFAKVLGSTHTDVQRTATVQVQSALPPKQKLIPFWLPSGCGYGPAQADTAQGNQAAPATATPTPTPTPTSSTATASATPTSASPTPVYGFTPGPSDSGSHVLAGTSPIAVAQGGSVTISTYSVTNLPNNTDRASLRFWSPNGTTYVDYAAQSVAKKQSVLAVPSFPVGPEVTATAGDWRVYALVQSNNQVRYSSNYLIVRVTATPTTAPATSSAPPSATASVTPTVSASPSATSVPVGCVGQDRGNFGQLDSPRLDGSSTQKRLARNIAGGLDHMLAPFEFAPAQTPTKDCGDGPHGFITGAQPDNVSSSDPPRNCIQGDTGNDGPALYDGLVTGSDDGQAARLAVSRGHTHCPADPSRVDVTIGGHLLNNDVLSCFLTNGATLTDITSDTGVNTAMLDPAIIASPRFVWLPMVLANDRAQKNFQPIIDFVPAFITNETQTSAAYDVGSSHNGLEINGNSVKTLTVLTFNKAALPIDEQSPTVDYDPTLAQSIVRLVG
ncbi:TadE/TadG family type IV pilus assembly protein [Nocardioides sp. LS1]|uniref:TadE/TadG family type IV pilus assembly protein n=1 Tax=Nocardioides sp. LS1 TaxID=1027620 RepID=UPI000F61F286|nr:TadE/TadG family type IV pilus assembly protein [Nocardioides sp. LS1]GCD91905.1 hypothetical protein NLS1_39110 [Nocardioides sp. LS1]